MSLHTRPDEFGIYPFAQEYNPVVAPTIETGQLAVNAAVEGILNPPESLFDAFDAIDIESNEQAAQQVEDFLEENAGLFAASDTAWKNVKEQQGVTLEVRENFVRTQDVLNMADKPNLRPDAGRRLRRFHERTHDARDRIMLSSLSNDTVNGFKRVLVPALNQISDQGSQRTYFRQCIEPSIEDYKKNLVKVGARGDLVEAAAVLCEAYYEAYFADYQANRQLQSFATEAGAALPVFLDRLGELSKLARHGAVEYPGLLELLATEYHQHGEKSMLFQRVTEQIGDPSDYAEVYLEECMEEQSGQRKELSAALAVMRLTSDMILGPEFQIDRAGYVKRLAEHWQSWPEQLLSGLKTFADKKAGEYRKTLKDNLNPFVRQGRLPAKGTRVEVSVKRGTIKAAQGKKSASVMPSAAKTQDMGDVVPTAELEPISRFAFLSNTGTLTRQNVFRLSEIDSIEAILEIKHFKKYLEKYRHVDNLSENILAALQKLTTDPYDPTSTKPWKGKGSHFYLEDNRDAMRRLRRFSFQDFPGVSGSSIAAKTRLAYSILDVKGKPTLVVYGIFLKQDIENIVGLPVRA